ncbi:MAG: YheV family putative metal-binding protein [Gammaproteobacteria bacterium]|nr:YheV family putative metal-binding protein [Gammaproteobacteria bacterium]
MSKKKSPKRRFIAGAICPRCSEMDKIVNYKLDEQSYRECVACGFKDKIRLQSTPQELNTRVTDRSIVAESPIKIIFPSSK